MRRAFLALAWRPLNLGAESRAEALGARIDIESGWERRDAVPGLLLWTDPSQPLAVRRATDGPGLVLGDVFATPGADPVIRTLARPFGGGREWLVGLSRACWGQYLAVAGARGDEDALVYRDPSGALDVMTWDLGEGLCVLASDMTRAPRWLRPRRQSLNWDRIGRMLAVPYASTSTSLFDDIDDVAPGQMLALAATPKVEMIWSPGAFVGRGSLDLRDVQAELVRRLDACTAALVSCYDRVLVELSGGLDSSVLASALHATGETGRVAAWVNFQGDRAEGNESRYASDVTDRIAVELTRVHKEIVPVDEKTLAELAREFWPAIGGVDVGRDRLQTQMLRDTGARAILSGQGGDGVYFQAPTAMVAADEFHRQGWRALMSPVLPNVARRAHMSVWAVLNQIRLARRGQEKRLSVWSGILAPDLQASVREIAHPWVLDARSRGLPPGKVLHIQGIAVTHVYNNRSRRRRVADLVYPHFAQPVTELCLGIDVPDLAGGSYDRPFARQAFAGRLPASVLQRRGKGNLTAYFAHLVAESAEALRPYLLDGCLCGAGLLDRAELEALLDPDRLIWRAAPTDVLWAAVTEAWARYWQTQAPDSPSAPRRTRG
jgi:asparagine synthase (glutamine-hydrolysing)